MQTLFAALLSLGSIGGPSAVHGHQQGPVAREATTTSYALTERATASKESDRPDPNKSGGNALPPAAVPPVEPPAP